MKLRYKHIEASRELRQWIDIGLRVWNAAQMQQVLDNTNELLGRKRPNPIKAKINRLKMEHITNNKNLFN